MRSHRAVMSMAGEGNAASRPSQALTRRDCASTSAAGHAASRTRIRLGNVKIESLSEETNGAKAPGESVVEEAAATGWSPMLEVAVEFKSDDTGKGGSTMDDVDVVVT
ncbi:unnamed protein product [Peronospora farinosa]|uniref:Uncharacterized protein n=1 Tax=Peronospora farinosa TaxID=134698 RepID=A0AAV0U971_9STRA|nr:unnamed protein product [Peronospora farinosa]CAI5733319.1 unnamed protein product [Peronospora farinosa]